MTGTEAKSGTLQEAKAEPAFDRRMLEALVCPLTQTVLEYDAEAQELVSRAANLAFPIRNGIPVMLEDEARTLD
ncbi:Trm112 family protein [Cribrihabitans neustonicus]|uniref:Trm112 family protein n=1 Tax=Cribrihabitans neustonicus TaxID=1429085 RepID=UPI003B5A2678